MAEREQGSGGGGRRDGGGSSGAGRNAGAPGPAGQRSRGQRSGDSRSSGRRSTAPPPGQRAAGPRGDRFRQRPRTAEQERYDGPPIPEDVTGQELDRSVLAQLRGLPDKLASRVARHLVAAGRLLDDDPETAYQHTLAARARAARVAVVREATGEAAYAAGHFAEALSELRAARRMNGADDYLPVMADCERAVGRPERALALSRHPAVGKLPVDQRIEMVIVEAGARFDLGEVEGALRTLENAPLKAETRAEWVVRLRYAYADMLLRAGRRSEAVEWFHRTAGVDGAGLTDAAERIEELERAGGDAAGEAVPGPQT